MLRWVLAMPVWGVVATPLKPESQTMTVRPPWLPEHLSDLTFDNYRSVLFFGRGVDLIKSFGNSIYVSLIGTVLVIPTTLLTASLGVRAAHARSKRTLEIAFGCYLSTVVRRWICSLLSGQ